MRSSVRSGARARARRQERAPGGQDREDARGEEPHAAPAERPHEAEEEAARREVGEAVRVDAESARVARRATGEGLHGEPVDGDVLGGGGEGQETEQHPREPGDGRRRGRGGAGDALGRQGEASARPRVGEDHAAKRREGSQDPALARADAVHQGGPEELERPGQRQQGEPPDLGLADPQAGQMDGRRVVEQPEREPGRQVGHHQPSVGRPGDGTGGVTGDGMRIDRHPRSAASRKFRAGALRPVQAPNASWRRRALRNGVHPAAKLRDGVLGPFRPLRSGPGATGRPLPNPRRPNSLRPKDLTLRRGGGCVLDTRERPFVHSRP